jgi:AcrR family transcriptional regulator
MRKTSDATRQRILETAYEQFYRKGFARVGVDEIAEHSGLTKRTLYYHFESKDALLAAVLEFHHALALQRIQRWTERLRGDADTLLEQMFENLAEWAATPRWAGAGFTRLAMELADLPGHPARAVAKRHKAAVEAWLADELARRKVPAPQVRAREVALLLEGSMSLMLIHGDRGYARTAVEAAKALVFTARDARAHS